MRPSLLSFFLSTPQTALAAAALRQKGFRLTIYLLFARFSFDFASSQFLVVNLSFAFPNLRFRRLGRTQHVNDLVFGGEYRIRTDDLLHAMQAL